MFYFLCLFLQFNRKAFPWSGGARLTSISSFWNGVPFQFTQRSRISKCYGLFADVLKQFQATMISTQCAEEKETRFIKEFSLGLVYGQICSGFKLIIEDWARWSDILDLLQLQLQQTHKIQLPTTLCLGRIVSPVPSSTPPFQFKVVWV